MPHSHCTYPSKYLGSWSIFINYIFSDGRDSGLAFVIKYDHQACRYVNFSAYSRRGVCLKLKQWTQYLAKPWSILEALNAPRTLTHSPNPSQQPYTLNAKPKPQSTVTLTLVKTLQTPLHAKKPRSRRRSPETLNSVNPSTNQKARSIVVSKVLEFVVDKKEFTPLVVLCSAGTFAGWLL